MHIQTLVLPALTLFTTAFAQSNVIDLTPDNFDAEVFAGKPSLVEFYAPWYASKLYFFSSDVAGDLLLTRDAGVATAKS